MERRWAMTNSKSGIHIEVAFSVIGHQFLKGVRKSYPDLFGNCRIVDILQANPSEIKIGVIYYAENGRWVDDIGNDSLHKPYPMPPSRVPDSSK